MNPPGKVIHTVGAVGRVEWKNLGGHNYSGVFNGAQHGLVRWIQIFYKKTVEALKKSFFCRLSLALEPNTEKMNTAPGMGLKFLRDGVDSANLVADCPNQLICLTLFFLHWLGGHVLCGRPGVVELLQE